MASRFWVAGGTGSWVSADTSNWSATSGGASGASVPGTADDVFFDANSGAGTATKAASALTIGSLDMTGSTATIAWASRVMVISAGGTGTIVKLVAAKCSGAVSFTFSGTVDQTFTSDNYVNVADIIRQGASGTTQKLIFASADTTCTGTISLLRAKIDFNGKNVRADSFTFSTGAVARELIMGSGTLTLTNLFTNSTGTVYTLTINTATLVGDGSLIVTWAGAADTLPPIICQTSAIGGAFTMNSASPITSLQVWKLHAVTCSLQFNQNTTVNDLRFVSTEQNNAIEIKSNVTAFTVTGAVPICFGTVSTTTTGVLDGVIAAGTTPWVLRDRSTLGATDTSSLNILTTINHGTQNSWQEGRPMLMGVG